MGLTDTLKKMYENMPKRVKFALSPLFIRLMVKNKSFQKTWNELDRFEKMSSMEKAEYQKKALMDTLINAYENVPYYKKLFDDIGFSPYKLNDIEDIKKIPILEKDVAVDAGEQLYNTDPNLAEHPRVVVVESR